MASPLLFFFLVLLSATSQSPISHSFSDDLTAYDMLEKYGFPKGILPEGATGYLLREDGTFEVFLGDRDENCNFKADGGYLLSYKRRITGRLEPGALRDLKGVSVKVLFVWFGITDVVETEGELSFYVGPLSASFPLSNFEECPRCRCGFDCASSASRLVSDS